MIWKKSGAGGRRNAAFLFRKKVDGGMYEKYNMYIQY